MDQMKAEELVRRLATALRSTDLDSPTHPLVQRGVDGLAAAATEALQAAPSVVIGFLGDEDEGTVRAAYAGPNWDRLRELKRRYDPDNLFRANNNIPPADG